MDNRPDFSNYLVHFTKGGRPCSRAKTNPALTFTQDLTAQKRLQCILKEKVIHASELCWIHENAVCFTECVWSSLLAHASNYSSYGIGFSKEFIFKNGGNPVFYVRPSLYEHLKTADKAIKPFLTPLQPPYSQEKMTQHRIGHVDYSHEREWRVAHDLSFDKNDIAFVIVQSIKDLQVPELSVLAKNIGWHKFIVMDNYKQIEHLWPMHKVDVRQKK